VQRLLPLALILTGFPSFALAGGQAAATLAGQRQAAFQLEQQGQNAEAEAAWRAILKAHPSDAESLAQLGLLEARQQRYKEAIPHYRKALALNPKLPGLRLDLALALFKDGDLKAAIPELRQLLNRVPPNSPEAQRYIILLAMAHYGLAEYADAVPYLKRAAAQDKQNLPLRLTLAHSCMWSKQYQCVLDTYHEILLLNAASAEADMLAGEALDEMKDVPGAIEQFRAAAKADPNMPDVHFGLGYLLWTKEQYPEAAPEFQAELNNNPGHAQALTYLGDVNYRLSRPDAAVPLLEKAVEIDPAIELAHLDLGSIDSDAGRHAEALRELMVAAKLAPNDVDVHWRLGRLYKAMNKLQEAKAEFEKAKSITDAADTALINKMTPPPVPNHASPTAPQQH
jgi:tetratricopeptide (TPR) repeat protein